MRNLAGFRDSITVRHAFGLVLCCLLFFFAVAAKSAMYDHNQSQVKNLTAAKVFENTALTAPTITAKIELTVVAVAVVMFFAVVLLYAGESHREQRARALTGWYSPDLAVRPPPTI